MDFKVTISSEQGVDTKFLFPGLMPHKSGLVSAEGPHNGTGHYEYWEVKDGVVSTTSHWIQLDSPYEDGFFAGNHDVSGSLVDFKLMTDGSPDASVLASISATYGGSPAGFDVNSISMVTPNDLVGESISASLPTTFTLIGNVGNDTLRGSEWGDTLDGGRGADLMIGGGGSDTYHVDSKHDVVQDSSGGSDSILTSISLTAPSSIEYLSAESWAGAINLTGNSKNNQMSGNSSANILKGLGGNDLLAGGDGHDTLTGGDGKDFFYFGGGASATLTSAISDHVTDFKTGHDQIWLQQSSLAFLGASIPVPPGSLLAKTNSIPARVVRRTTPATASFTIAMVGSCIGRPPAIRPRSGY